jgi:hypothetical protein
LGLGGRNGDVVWVCCWQPIAARTSSRSYEDLHDEGSQGSISRQIGLYCALADRKAAFIFPLPSRVEEGRRLEPLEEVVLEVDAEKVGAADCNAAVCVALGPSWMAAVAMCAPCTMALPAEGSPMLLDAHVQAVRQHLWLMAYA